MSEISKQSAIDERAQQKVDQQMRQIEDAAARAYAGDIGRGADMTSRAIAALNAAAGLPTATPAASPMAVVAGACGGGGSAGRNGRPPQIGPQLDESASQPMAGGDRSRVQRPGTSAAASSKRTVVDPMMPPQEMLDEDERLRRERMLRRGGVSGQFNANANDADRLPPPPENSMWCEAKSDNGDTYYWNVKTNATVWEEPAEGFMTLLEYQRINELALAQQAVQSQEESLFMRQNADEIVAK